MFVLLLSLCGFALFFVAGYPYINKLKNFYDIPKDIPRPTSIGAAAKDSTKSVPSVPKKPLTTTIKPKPPTSTPEKISLATTKSTPSVPTKPPSTSSTANGPKPKKEKFLVVSAISSNHHIEEEDMIATAQHFFPNSRIIIYDIGLKQTEINTLKKYCNVEVRTFPFDKYPPHVKNLHTYAWKPLIIQAAAQEADFIFWADSSVRFVKNFDDTFSKLDDFPIKGHLHPICKIVHVTHDATLKYLNVTREMLGQVVGIEAGIMLVKTNELAMHIINLWRSCALEVSCIAPEGSQVYGCDYGKGKPTTIAYIGCHRFDQSALNSILIRDYGKEVFTKILNSVVNKMKVIHAPTKTFKIKHCE